MNRKFYGNQYIGNTWRTTKLIVVGTWIGIKEMFHNPGKVLLAVLMLGLASATFVETSTPHRLWIASAYADLMSEDKVEYVREVVEVPEGPELPSIFYFIHPLASSNPVRLRFPRHLEYFASIRATSMMESTHQRG